MFMNFQKDYFGHLTIAYWYLFFRCDQQEVKIRIKSESDPLTISEPQAAQADEVSVEKSEAVVVVDWLDLLESSQQPEVLKAIDILEEVGTTGTLASR
jgi:hypothetical protein